MNKSKFFLIILGIIVFTALILRLTGEGREDIVKEQIITTESEVIVGDDKDMQSVNSEKEVIVSNVIPDQAISSPLSILGWAKGNWFFEANLPIKIVDENNNIILAHFGTAQGDWMTSEMVPFKSTLDFKSGEAVKGYLVISKDNPSGLPENDASFKIPVRFK